MQISFSNDEFEFFTRLLNFLITILTRFLSRHSKFFKGPRIIQDLIKGSKRKREFAGKSKIFYIGYLEPDEKLDICFRFLLIDMIGRFFDLI